jgi:hypothetical protein
MKILVFLGMATPRFDGSLQDCLGMSSGVENSAVLLRILTRSEPSGGKRD